RQDSCWTPVPVSFDFDRWNSIRSQVGTDKGKFLLGGEKVGERHVRPLITLDLTHCSTLQLEEVGGPLFILNSVKYPHEMVKWANTGGFGFAASLWGPGEKLARVGAKLDHGRVWLNGWWSNEVPFAGVRKSFFGIPGFRPQGD